MQFDINLTGNGSQRVEAVGRFFKYKSGQGPIRVKTSTGAYVDLEPGQGVSGAQFSGLTVEDRSGAGNVGVLLAGEFAFEDDTVTGTIGTYDDTAQLTFNGNCFIGDYSPPSGNNNYAFGALVNPAGSGKNVAITAAQVWISQTAAGAFSGTAASERVYLFLAPVLAQLGASAGLFRNKKSGAPKSVMYKASYAGGGVPLSTLLQNAGVSADDSQPLVTVPGQDVQKVIDLALSEPILIAPGWALYLTSNGTYGGVAIKVEFREETA